MKYFIPMILLLLMQHQCSTSSSSKLSSENEQLMQGGKKTVIVEDSLSNALFLNCTTWINSWEKNLTTDSFVFVKKFMLPSISWWEDFDILEESNALYCDMLCHSPNGMWVLDLYSSQIELSKDNSKIHGTMDVDTEVYLIDVKRKQKMPIFQCGSLESVDDGFWLSDSVTIIVGSTTCLENGSQTYQPYMLMINVFTGNASEFKYTKKFPHPNMNFLKQKFPKIIFDL